MPAGKHIDPATGFRPNDRPIDHIRERMSMGEKVEDTKRRQRGPKPTLPTIKFGRDEHADR